MKNVLKMNSAINEDVSALKKRIKELEQSESEHKKMEELLKESEERFRGLSEASLEAVVFIEDGIIIDANKALNSLFGYEGEELRGMPATDFIVPERRSFTNERMRKRTKGVYETLGLKKDRSIFPIEVNSREFEHGGKQLRISAVRDLTERKQAEEALHDSEERYRQLVESINKGICVAQDGMLKFVNPMLMEILGYSKDDLTTLPFTEFIHPDDRRIVLERHTRRMKGDKFSTKYEFRILTSDGSIKWVELDSVTIQWEGKTGILTFIGDITLRKQADEELKKHRNHLEELVEERTIKLKESETKYKTLVESVSEWIWEADASGACTYASPRVYDILGYTPEEVLGKRPFEFMPPEEAKRLSTVSERLVAEKKPLLSLEGVYCHKDGHLVFQEINGFPFFDGEGNLLGYRGSDRDITEQKKIMTELQQSKSDLENKSRTVEELNIALKVLLKQIKEDKENLEERMLSNVKKLVLPYLEKINKARLDEQQRSCLAIMEANLNEIISPFLHNVQQLNLSPRETQVANLIKDGKTTKEIADIMGLAPASVDFYRKNIRDKLKLTNRKVNLQSYLQTLK